jgi:hypothetical protein
MHGRDTDPHYPAGRQPCPDYMFLAVPRGERDPEGSTRERDRGADRESDDQEVELLGRAARASATPSASPAQAHAPRRTRRLAAQAATPTRCSCSPTPCAAASPRSSPSSTTAWPPRPSASSAAPSRSWPTTSRSAPTPASTPSSAATPTSATSAPSPARRPPRLRHQRLRRDHPWPLRVGRQAHGHQPHPRRTRGRREERPLPRGRPRLPRALPHHDAQLRAHARARGRPLPGPSPAQRAAHLADPAHGRARHAAAQPRSTSPSPSLQRLPTSGRPPQAPSSRPQPSPSARIFKTNPPDLTRVHGDAARDVLDSLATYAESLQPERRHFLAQYTPLDVAFKVVGTGSVGLRDYCIYMQGNGRKDPLFLQIKEEAPPPTRPISARDRLAIAPGPPRRRRPARHAAPVRPLPRLDHHPGPRLPRPPAQRPQGLVEMDELKAAGLLEYATSAARCSPAATPAPATAA